MWRYINPADTTCQHIELAHLIPIKIRPEKFSSRLNCTSIHPAPGHCSLDPSNSSPTEHVRNIRHGDLHCRPIHMTDTNNTDWIFHRNNQMQVVRSMMMYELWCLNESNRHAQR